MSRSVEPDDRVETTRELAVGRVAIDDMDRYHILDEEYNELCAVEEGEPDVYDSNIADLSERRLCHRCRLLKQEILGGRP